MRDDFKTARERYDEAKAAMSEQRARMVEDLRFSNPADPQQWDENIYKDRFREKRPAFVFDQTNQFIAQVVNDSRMNKPQIQTVPASSGADEKVSEALDGMIRQIEYASSASIAYDTAQEHAARVGLGWVRLVPKVIDKASNAQEIRILRVHDPLSVTYDPNFTMPDGSDQMYGFVEATLSKAQFMRQYPKHKGADGWKSTSDGWIGENSIRICECFEIKETKKSRIRIRAEKEYTVSEDEYWDTAKKTGVKLDVAGQYDETERIVRWSKMFGDDYLEDSTEFPSRWIPLVPVLGYETWIEGKRYLCGMVRRMRAGQQAYNFERNAEIEWMTMQPKSPYLAAWESIANHQDDWAGANASNKVYLPYDHVDTEGNPLPPPQRLNPPSPGAAFAQMGQKGIADIQASIGMYRANLGAPSNETSGIAIKRREQQGDTANFHYIDNLARSMTHLGRIIVDMIPRLYDEERSARILGLDGKSDAIKINPSMKSPVKMAGKKIAEINLTTGTYDVRCKVGPAYASLREEAAESLTKIVQSNPQLMTVLGPMWARMQDWPEAEKVSKLLLALAPPPVQMLENSDVDIPPQLMAQMEQMKQAIEQRDMQMQQMQQAMQQMQAEAGQEMHKLQQALQEKDMDQSAEIEKAALGAQVTEQTEGIKAQTQAQVAIQKAQIDAAAKIVIAQIDARATMQAQAETAAMQGQEVAPEPLEPAIDTQAMMAEAFAMLAQTLAASQAPKPPIEIIHERDPQTGLLVASREVPA